MDDTIKNSKTHDNGAKLIFDDPILCAQFLRGYTNIDILKDVQPEDIKDISERFLPMWQEGHPLCCFCPLFVSTFPPLPTSCVYNFTPTPNADIY